MKHDDLFAGPEARGGDFEFDERVAEVFDNMLVRSIPFYAEQQQMVQALGATYWAPGTRVYDLGCSTATTLINLGRAIQGPAELVGYDNSPAMLEQAQRKISAQGLQDRICLAVADLEADPSEMTLANASVVTLCWTLQFIRPMHRDRLIRSIYQGLVENGVLIVAEKILAGSGPVNREFIDRYHEFKRQNGYSDHEIARKREALENVLVPYTLAENRALFQRNGFSLVETYFQWYNFAGFLCVKQAGQAQ